MYHNIGVIYLDYFGRADNDTELTNVVQPMLDEISLIEGDIRYYISGIEMNDEYTSELPDLSSEDNCWKVTKAFIKALDIHYQNKIITDDIDDELIDTDEEMDIIMDDDDEMKLDSQNDINKFDFSHSIEHELITPKFEPINDNDGHMPLTNNPSISSTAQTFKKKAVKMNPNISITEPDTPTNKRVTIQEPLKLENVSDHVSESNQSITKSNTKRAQSTRVVSKTKSKKAHVKRNKSLLRPQVIIYTFIYIYVSNIN